MIVRPVSARAGNHLQITHPGWRVFPEGYSETVVHTRDPNYLPFGPSEGTGLIRKVRLN